MSNELTDRQNRILGLLVEGHSRTEIAKILDVSYQTVKKHLAEICCRLELENHYVRFDKLKAGDSFVSKGVRYTRVSKTTDRFGGYNAQDGDGKRRLFRRDEIVEVTHGE